MNRDVIFETIRRNVLEVLPYLDAEEVSIDGSLSELGAITIRSTTGNRYQFSVDAQSVQTQNMVALSASDSLYSSGTVVLTGLGAATVNTGAGSIRISVPIQSAQTGISGIANLSLLFFFAIQL